MRPSGIWDPDWRDRDGDGWFSDRYELDHGTDPADPASFPGAPTTTTTSTTSTTTVPVVLIQAQKVSLKDDGTPPPNPSRRKVTFTSSTRTSAPANRIVPPSPNGSGDPTLFGAELRVYNATGATTDDVSVALPSGWFVVGSPVNFKGYRYTNPAGLIRGSRPRTTRSPEGRRRWMGLHPRRPTGRPRSSSASARA